jgi:CheY-like chemotaxis protein
MGEEESRRWVLDEAPRLVEVTAFNPLNGRSRKLASTELHDILELLLGLEEKPGDAALLGHLSDFGLDPSWLDDVSRKSRPLFMARRGSWESVGYSLRELLGAMRVAGGHSDGGTRGRPRDKTVFIVDDDDSIRDLLAYAIGREGFQTDVFANGAEVVQKIRNMLPDAQPHLLILDLMMPQRGGYDVIRDLQSDEFPDIPIIVVTGRHIDRTAVEELRAERNVREFLAKPVNPKTLAMSVHDLLKTAPAR